MAKYSKKAGDKVGEVMREMKAGKLKSSTGKKVTNPKQAIAIGLSEARAEGAKVPKKAAAKKTVTKKSTPKKPPQKKLQPGQARGVKKNKSSMAGMHP